MSRYINGKWVSDAKLARTFGVVGTRDGVILHLDNLASTTPRGLALLEL